jgi:hypothetical protein
MTAASPPATRSRALLAERLYKRLGRLGLGSLIRPVKDAWTRWGREALFIADDRGTFEKALLSSGRFCKDTLTGGVLHPGQISLREVADGRGLHLVLGRDGRLYAHVDAVAPAVSARPDGQCRYSRTRTSAHIRREVLPLLWSLHAHPPARGYRRVVARLARRGPDALPDRGSGWVLAFPSVWSGSYPRAEPRRAAASRRSEHLRRSVAGYLRPCRDPPPIPWSPLPPSSHPPG